MATKFRFKVKGGYVIGAITLPTAVGNLTVSSVGGSKADALLRAAKIADRIASDPVMRAIMPPQATAAIIATKMLGRAAQRGAPAIRALWGKMRGDGKRRLAEALAKEAEDAERARVSGSRNPWGYPNRGAWQPFYDPYYDDEDGYDDDAEGYDEESMHLEGEDVGRRKKRKRKKRSYRGEGGRTPRTAQRDEAPPVDEEQPPEEPYEEPYAEGGEG